VALGNQGDYKKPGTVLSAKKEQSQGTTETREMLNDTVLSQKLKKQLDEEQGVVGEEGISHIRQAFVYCLFGNS
jgi:hypothetical protein